jgi:hypothetical protein
MLTLEFSCNIWHQNGCNNFEEEKFGRTTKKKFALWVHVFIFCKVYMLKAEHYIKYCFSNIFFFLHYIFPC